MQPFQFPFYLLINVSIHPSIHTINYIPFHTFIHSFVYPSIHLSICPSILSSNLVHVFLYSSINSCNHQNFILSICTSIHASFHHPSIGLFIHHPFIHLSILLSIHPSIYLSILPIIHPSINSSIHLSILSSSRCIFLFIHPFI